MATRSIIYHINEWIYQYKAENFGQGPGYIKIPSWRKNEFRDAVGSTIMAVIPQLELFIHEQYKGVIILWSDKIDFIELGQLIGNKA